MTVFELESADLKDFKSFVFLKPFLSQFKYCTYKKRTMTGKFDVVSTNEIVWNNDILELLRFEDYLRKCCSVTIKDNMLVIGEYALKLKN
jgi:hypothetical protein